MNSVRPIPGIPGFIVDEYGEVTRLGKGVQSVYLNGDGYKTSAVIVNGEWVTMPVQRLVAAAFINGNFLFDSKMHVNHRDFDKENNFYLNLEWLTVKENNIHASMFRTDPVNPTIYGINSYGQERLFMNVFESAEKLGVLPVAIWDAVRFGLPINGWFLRHHKWNDKIPKSLHRKTILVRDKGGRKPERKVKVRSVHSGIIWKFNTVMAAARFFDTDPSGINQVLKRSGTPSLFRKQFQIEYEENEFLTLSNNQLFKLIYMGPKPVFVINLNTRKAEYYDNATEFYLICNLSKKAVTTILVKDSKRILENRIFTYLHNRNTVEELKNIYIVR